MSDTYSLDKLRSRLAWRVGGSWKEVELDGQTGLEATDRNDRLLRLFPHPDGGVFGLVRYVEDWSVTAYLGIDTWGGTPKEAVDRGYRRLQSKLEAVATERDLDAPRLSAGSSTTSRQRSTSRQKGSDVEQKSLIDGGGDRE